MEIDYRGYRIQKLYGVIDLDGDIKDYVYTLTQAKKTVDKMIKSHLQEQSGETK